LCFARSGGAHADGTLSVCLHYLAVTHQSLGINMQAFLSSFATRRCHQTHVHWWLSPGAATDGQVTVVVHVTPAEVAALEPYRQWMAAFGGGDNGAVQHIMANTAANRGRTVMSSSAAVQAKLNAVAPAIFPLPSTSWPLSVTGGEVPGSVGRCATAAFARETCLLLRCDHLSCEG